MLFLHSCSNSLQLNSLLFGSPVHGIGFGNQQLTMTLVTLSLLSKLVTTLYLGVMTLLHQFLLCFQVIKLIYNCFSSFALALSSCFLF